MDMRSNLAEVPVTVSKPLLAEKKRRGRPKMTLRDRHEQKFTMRGPDDCWTWTGAVNKQGYGIMQGEKKNSTVRAHRVAYELNVGPVPDGKLVMHSCDCPGCQNPRHLKVGTYQDNSDDKIRKGRNAHLRKLDDGQVLEIVRLRAEHGLPLKTIGVMYGVSGINVGMIMRGKIYGWLTGIGRDAQLDMKEAA